MFIIYGVLFLLGFYLFGLAFTVSVLPGLVFVAGILCISLALALPIHFSRKA